MQDVEDTDDDDDADDDDDDDDDHDDHADDDDDSEVRACARTSAPLRTLNGCERAFVELRGSPEFRTTV